MSLAARRSTRRREDFVIRLGCLLVSFAVLASLVLEPPRAKAFALTSSAVTALAGGFLNACGLAPVVSGMSSSGEVNESLARLLQDFLNEEVGGISVSDWALSFGEIGLAVKDKKIVIPKPFAEKLNQFAQWVEGKYGTKAGVNVVYDFGDYVLLADGTKFFLSTCDDDNNLLTLGTLITKSNSPIVFPTGYYFSIGPLKGTGSNSANLYHEDGSVSFGSYCSETTKVYIAARGDYALFFWDGYGSMRFWVPAYLDYIVNDVVTAGESLSLDVAETLTIPESLTDNQSIALDVGATQSMEIQEILQGILDAILAGDLAASAEIVDEAVEPVDPPAGELPDVDGLGLPALGAALTSRFPFSIPWDVYKGVTLLAAPPKAPYFEVDFMAPIADRVGGWQGSTKIVLDFSEYEIIGQVCRWTSTIGFCLMLATGTKRLIWTA